ncbi:hypothetical protein LCGC14_0883460 [marine sediment metagenome]|uniref:Uncharacterized protein n=1 Tax=marine sediment metagenome TaxID=412755 RepID=A0A0F9PLU8_9ZZZZ
MDKYEDFISRFNAIDGVSFTIESANEHRNKGIESILTSIEAGNGTNIKDWHDGITFQFDYNDMRIYFHNQTLGFVGFMYRIPISKEVERFIQENGPLLMDGPLLSFDSHGDEIVEEFSKLFSFFKFVITGTPEKSLVRETIQLAHYISSDYTDSLLITGITILSNIGNYHHSSLEQGA